MRNGLNHIVNLYKNIERYSSISKQIIFYQKKEDKNEKVEEKAVYEDCVCDDLNDFTGIQKYVNYSYLKINFEFLTLLLY